MSSRKSSASFPKPANIETTSSSDVLVFTGARPVQPSRQPHFPPPVERQKDEGFARFLKKHSSPTHNRVTAGGRIVPIEPRSPPPFALSASATNRPDTRLADKLLQKSAKSNADLPWTMNMSFNQYLDNNDTVGFNTNSGYSQNVTSLQNGTRQPQMMYGSSFGTQTGLSSSVSPERLPAQSQLAGGPVMPPAVYGQPNTLITGMQSSASNFGVQIYLPESYVHEPAFDHGQQMAHSSAAQPGFTPFQTLMAWEQHYAQLDQQLKDIDRHRAMSNLDPRLAEQRRVIVQQRSDAKDTVRELQAMLGVKRRLESSQDSWHPSFNVDAPVYVPQNALVSQASLTHRPSFEVSHIGVIEKPRGHGQRRAIPIVPPPEHDQHGVTNREVRSLHPSREGSTASEKSSTRSDSLVAKLEPRSSASSQQLQPSIPMKGDLSRAGSQRSCSSQAQTRIDEQASVGEVELNSLQAAEVNYPANDLPPSTLPEEYVVLIQAINRPKGTISQVRLLDNRVIDVEGQGLGLISSPTAARSQLSSTSASDSRLDVRGHSMHGGSSCATPVNQYGPSNINFGKENVSVAPKSHQKAATDAFLAQYNAIDDNMALGIRPETQSLRAASNSHLQSYEQNAEEYYQRGLLTLASRENIPQLTHQKSLGENKHGLAYSVADEKVFEAGEGDFVGSDALNTKGYSVTSIQNVHALRSLPNSFNGAVEARQSFQAQLNAASKARSPRFLRRFGANGGA